MKKFVFGVFALVFAFAVANTSVSAQMYSAKSNEKDIVDTAVATESLSTLVAAVKAAGLVETLKRQRPVHGFRTGLTMHSQNCRPARLRLF